MSRTTRGSILLGVLIGGLILAIGTTALLVTLQYNLRAVRAERLRLQADTLADTAIDEVIATLRSSSDLPGIATAEWTYVAPNTATTLIGSPQTIIATDNHLFYREIDASHLSAQQAFYGFVANQAGTLYDIYGFGLVQAQGENSLVQKHKAIFRSSNDVSLNFFVQSSESAAFLTITKP